MFSDCSSECGKGTSVCVMGEYVQCSAATPTKEVCDGLDNNCDGLIDNSEDCYPSVPDYWYDDEEDDGWVDHKDTNSTDVEELPDEPKNDATANIGNSGAWEVYSESAEPETEGQTVIEIETGSGGCATGHTTGGIPMIVFLLAIVAFLKKTLFFNIQD